MWLNATRPFIVANLAKVAAVGLLALAWILRRDTSNPGLPLWFSLVLLAILLYFSARHEGGPVTGARGGKRAVWLRLSQGFTSLERQRPDPDERMGPLRRWLEQRRASRLHRQCQVEADEERRVDDILARLHEQGIEALSDEDRLLLKAGQRSLSSTQQRKALMARQVR